MYRVIASRLAFAREPRYVFLFRTNDAVQILHQTIEIGTITNGRKDTVKGRAVRVEGRSATLQLHKPMRGGQVHSIVTIGKECLTSAEGRRELIVLNALRGSNALLGIPFVRLIWLPSESPGWLGGSRPAGLPVTDQTQKLNPSQRKAVQAIVCESDAHRFVLIQGPPGTGKTSVIACATQCLIDPRSRQKSVWLIAQSNVAVKNIAEKLAKVGLYDFKLLVSKEFHFDWCVGFLLIEVVETISIRECRHEHLYEKIEQNIIRSDNFSQDVVSMERQLAGSRVILCTLSMLSHHRLPLFTRLVPVEVVIVDEASQIEIGDYIPMLHLHERTIRKLVFIGDDKQCEWPVAFVHCSITSSPFPVPPYGQDDLGDLRSVFEIPHLRKHATFLDTQCMFFRVSQFQTTDRCSAFRPNARAFRIFYF